MLRVFNKMKSDSSFHIHSKKKSAIYHITQHSEDRRGGSTVITITGITKMMVLITILNFYKK